MDSKLAAKTQQRLSTYSLLGRTGLRVSPLGLGTMTFGWGSEKELSRTLLHRYLSLGGNVVDTADAYSNGASEEWLGEFMERDQLRDRIVLATKFTFGMQAGNPNSGGNGRKNIRRAVEASLKRLRTDRIDLYWLHAWDRLTPVEEVVRSLNDLIAEGKILHFGLSDVPAWYAARAHTLSLAEYSEPVAALQLEYSLISRNLEREHLPMAKNLGMAIQPWGPLASGFLTGKYSREGGVLSGKGRVLEVKDSGNPVLEKFAKDERNWGILESLKNVAKRLGLPESQVALNWVATRPGVHATLVGATTEKQLDANLASLAFDISAPEKAVLDGIGRPEANELDHFGHSAVQSWINAGTNVVGD